MAETTRRNGMKMRLVLKGVAVLALVSAGASGPAAGAASYIMKIDVAADAAARAAAPKMKLDAANTACWSAYAAAMQELKTDRPASLASEDIYQDVLDRWRRAEENLHRLDADVARLADRPPDFKYPSLREAARDARGRAYVALMQELETDYPDKITAEIAYQDAYRRWCDAYRRIGCSVLFKSLPPSYRYYPQIPRRDESYPINYAGQ
jgi:hypothetical protein